MDLNGQGAGSSGKSERVAVGERKSCLKGMVAFDKGVQPICCNPMGRELGE